MEPEKQTIYDPLRKKEVALTPEEEVRQWFIGVLRDRLKVPSHMMMSEVGMVYGAGKVLRADIVVWARGTGKPLMIVECKRPEVTLDSAVTDQALRYNNILDVKYIVITNGTKTFMFRREGDGFVFVEKAPLWEEM
ncbi:MAG: type I restriction enzyme HsdR N-terminal domain-containing protein [Bacteroidales bacterium]|nr:type I restriction enzyme HsdR N-terminal domain-containing protein [Bacteroidales bacterium]